MRLKAVLFDLHGTLAFLKNPLNSADVSRFLLKRDCEVYPQSLDAALHFVSMVEYPKQGYRTWQDYLKRVLRLLDTKTDSETLRELATLYQKHNTYTLFPDAAPAVEKAKQLKLQTAIVTTIASFSFLPAMKPIRQHLDVIMTGYEAGCEKSNPTMHKKTLMKLRVTPEEAIMIGDEPLVDIEIPRNLGIHTILLDRKNKISKKPQEADFKAASLTEAMAQIEQLKKAQ